MVYNPHMLKIITAPNRLLNSISEKVVIDHNTLALIDKMTTALRNTEGLKGVGLAAIQVGVPKKIFLAYSEKSKQLLTFINAEIIWSSKVLTLGLPQKGNRYEGCLSVPNVWAIVRRPKAIKIRYQTETNHQLVRKFAGLTAAIIQHEYDHTQGILFTEKALQQGNKLYTIKTDEEGKGYFEEIRL